MSAAASPPPAAGPRSHQHDCFAPRLGRLRRQGAAAGAYDGTAFHPATIAPEPLRPVEVIEIPTPLPMPGQLQPLPEPVKPDKRRPTMRVVAANRAALQEPSAHGYINAIQVYPYSEGALYRLYAAPEQVSDIALEPGEQLTAVSAGDTVRWVIGDTTSGTGESKRVHVLFKPFAPGLRTNLIITTDRRFYHLQLESTVRTSMAAISWTYPQGILLALQRRNASPSPRCSASAPNSVSDRTRAI